MCADELKESREMPLKSCLRRPFPFKCPLVRAGPGFRGSHGNVDSELFWRRFWNTDPGWRKDRYFCSCSFLPSWGCLRFWQLNELMAGSVRRGDWLQMRLKSGGFQCGFVSGLSAPTDMRHYFHCSYPRWQHHTANVMRGMFAHPLAQTYTYIWTNTSQCKLICKQSIFYILFGRIKCVTRFI